MSASQVVEAFGPPRIAPRLPTSEWIKTNEATWRSLFNELELECDRGHQMDGYLFHTLYDVAAFGIAILVTAEVIARSDGESFLEYWRAGDEKALLPGNDWIMKTGLIPRSDRRMAEEVVAITTFSEIEAWRLF